MLSISGDDDLILDIARDLCRRVGEVNLDIDRIDWQKSVPYGRAFLPVPSDQPMARRGLLHRRHVSITFPVLMKGRLRPLDWGPLIASLFAYSKVRRSNLASATIFGILITGTAGIAVIQTYYSKIFPPTVILGWLVGIFTLVILAPRLVRRSRDWVDAWLKADELAAGIVGKEDFLKILRGIDAMSMSDVEDLKRGKGPWARYRPSLTERIMNLETLASSS